MKRVLAVMTAVLMTAALLSGCNSAKSKEYKILDEAFSDEEYVIGFRKGDETPVSYTHLRLPEVSMPTSLRTNTLSRSIRRILEDSTTVIIMGRPSGTATTTTVMARVRA